MFSEIVNSSKGNPGGKNDMSIIELKEMSEIAFELPETFLRIVKSDPEYGIYLLEGEQLIFFPA
jgi:hypothetical protein